MGQVSAVMRRGEGRFFHWCPACEQMHPLPDSWAFDGNLEQPTFQPSFRQIGRDGSTACHYNVTGGQLVFHGDNPHAFNGRTVPMPALPAHPTDA